MLHYTVNEWAIGWKLEWNVFFLFLNIFFVIALDLLSRVAYYGGIFHCVEYISIKFYSWLLSALAFWNSLLLSPVAGR